MWTWANKENTAAVYIADGEPSIFCGINVEPLSSLISEGLEPEAFIEEQA